MCGIAALFSEYELDPRLIKNMTDAIKHRGPDSEGHENFSGQRAWLGHRRLSILDLTKAGIQPMSYNDRYWITYNGEIYNYIEIRNELMNAGYLFRTNTDTEVILAAYQHWGKDCLHYFNGMFAFVIYDTRTCKIFAARDRLGVKPLYYWQSPLGIAFASEIKQFGCLPYWNPKVNEARVYDFLSFAIFDHTSETMFKSVYQLRGGEAAELSLNDTGKQLSIYRWYELTPQEFSGSFDEAALRFNELMTDSVKLRLRADVEVGSCLSGGLDSSTIVCISNEILKSQGASQLQKTFSARSEHRKYDEGDYIHAVTKQLGVENYEICPALDQLFVHSDEITRSQDEPYLSTSIYAQWNVFRLASEKRVKVMLDGQGADELLAGYHTFFGPYFADFIKQGNLIGLMREMKNIKALHGYDVRFLLSLVANMLLPESIRQPLKRYNGRNTLKPDWLNIKILGIKPEDPFVVHGFKTDNVTAMSKSCLTGTVLPMLLHWEDRNSMAHSIESRVPFLDYRLVEFVLGLPDEYKLAQGTTKRILRQSMKGILPEVIRTRVDKLGFVTAEEIWMRKQRPQLFIKLLEEAIEASKGIINIKARTKAEKIISGQEPFNFFVWRLISFGSWMKQFNMQV